VIQKEAAGNDRVPVIILTHAAREQDVRNALKAVEASDIVKQPTQVIRIGD
jgi:homoserine dehydrogenase